MPFKFIITPKGKKKPAYTVEQESNNYYRAVQKFMADNKLTPKYSVRSVLSNISVKQKGAKVGRKKKDVFNWE